MSRTGAVRLDYVGLGQEGLVERRPDREFIIICSRCYKVLLCWLHSSKDLPQELCALGVVWSSVFRVGFGHFWQPKAGVLEPMEKLSIIQHTLFEGHQWLHLSQRSNLKKLFH